MIGQVIGQGLQLAIKQNGHVESFPKGKMRLRCAVSSAYRPECPELSRNLWVGEKFAIHSFENPPASSSCRFLIGQFPLQPLNGGVAVALELLREHREVDP